jgi:transcriptional regulator with XRE-family HTH domain
MTGNKETLKRLISLMGSGKNKMTLRRFSEKCGIGQSTMHNYLKGRRLDEKAINKICDAFGRSADWLLGRKECIPNEQAGRHFKMLVHEIRAKAASTEQFIKDMEGMQC